MIKIITPNTSIRIQFCSVDTDNETGRTSEAWVDIVNTDIPCEWKNKFGKELYETDVVKAIEPARLKLWFIPGVNPKCRVLRVEDGSLFDITSIDDIDNRHQQLVIEVKRNVAG